MSAETVALAESQRRRALIRRLVAEAASLWRRINRHDLTGSWQLAIPRVYALLYAAQVVAAREADTYLDKVLSAQGIDAAAVARVNDRALAGIASDGRDLMSLLYQPVIATKRAIGRGADTDRAMASGEASLTQIISTQLADAARVAVGIALVTRPRATGYVRMLSTPSCSRCAILAGRWYRWNAGFQRHPHCFPAGVVVSGPATSATSRRWYEGELVVLATTSGEQLALTGNHPVLTGSGWVPAHLLQEGDEVLRSTRPEGATPLVVPDHQQMPALIEDVWRSLGVGVVDRVPTSAEDFHGDGQDGEVDIAYANSALNGVWDTSLLQESREATLAIGRELALQLIQHRSSVLVDEGDAPQAHSCMGGVGLPPPFIGGHLCGSNPPSLAGPPSLDAVFGESPLDDVTADAVLAAERVLANTGQVRGGDGLYGEHLPPPRWDAPAGPLTMQSRGAYTSRGQDLLLRLTGQVEADRIIDLRRVEWSGHVYSLTSAEGWHSANNLIVSNCDCLGVPSRENVAGDLRTDPKSYFNSLSQADQDRLFTKAGAHAIRDGADMSRVVNARRGMETAARAEGRTGGRLTTRRVFGRDLFTTTEAITKYGINREIRLMPESIYSIADTRDEALRLLRVHGYIL